MSGQTFRVWVPDWAENEEDGRPVISYDFEEAAKAFTEQSYHEEPWEGCGLLVHVRSTSGETKAFSVHPENTVYFMAYEQAVEV